MRHAAMLMAGMLACSSAMAERTSVAVTMDAGTAGMPILVVCTVPECTPAVERLVDLVESMCMPVAPQVPTVTCIDYPAGATATYAYPAGSCWSDSWAPGEDLSMPPPGAGQCRSCP